MAQLLKCSLYKSKDLILDLLHSRNTHLESQDWRSEGWE